MIYRLGTYLAGPYLRHHLAKRTTRGKEDATRLNERYGIASIARPAGKLIWFHAASVGEGVALLALINAIIARYPVVHILVTSGTVTSAEILMRRLPPQAVHQYVPLDRRGWVDAFLDHWRPDAAIWTESEIWPNLLRGLKRRGVPSAIVNARLSAHSARQWKWLKGAFGNLLQNFSVRLAQSEEDAARLGDFGVAFKHVGNLKLALEPAPTDEEFLAALKQTIGNRPVWLAAMTHPGEEAIIFSVHKKLELDRLNLLTILVPRHPARGDEIAALAATEHLPVARRSLGQMPDAQAKIYLVDTIGELGTLYRVAPIVFVGGSLKFDGHSPMEAAQRGAAIVYGPLMRNNSSIAAMLENANAARRIAGEDDLGDTIAEFLGEPETVVELAGNARKIADESGQIVSRVMAELQPLFAEAGIA